MDEDRERKSKFLINLLEYTGETPNADYKSSVEFVEEEKFSLKLVKHILGMSNAGGGYLVIGYTENDKKIPVPDKKLTSEIVASYETTKLSQFVNKHVLGTDKINLVVWKTPFEKTDYPIIEVYGFQKRPFFCRSTKKGILTDGALYYRSKGNKSVELASPNDWDELIELVVKHHQDNLLVRFKGLLEQSGLKVGKQLSSESLEIDTKPIISGGFSNWKDRRREEVIQLMKSDNFDPEFMEVAHYLPDILNENKWDHRQLLEVAEKAVLRNTGWPIGVVIHNPEMKPKPVVGGIKAVVVGERRFRGFDLWYLRFDGGYYFARNLIEDTDDRLEGERAFYFDTQIWRIAESIDHAISLYKALEIEPNETIKISISYRGLKNRVLGASNQGRAFRLHYRKSDSESVEWVAKATLDDLFVNRKQYIGDAIRKVMVMFDFFEPSESIIDSILEEYGKSRL